MAGLEGIGHQVAVAEANALGFVRGTAGVENGGQPLAGYLHVWRRSGSIHCYLAHEMSTITPVGHFLFAQACSFPAGH